VFTLSGQIFSFSVHFIHSELKPVTQIETFTKLRVLVFASYLFKNFKYIPHILMISVKLTGLLKANMEDVTFGHSFYIIYQGYYYIRHLN